MLRKLGYLNGRHYTEYVKTVEHLIEQKEFDEVESLLRKLIEVIEQESHVTDCGVAPWYYEKLAVLYRKQKRVEDEIDILEHFANQKHAPGEKPSRLIDRLKKLKSH